ncbi:CLUMA_CG003956, isoform A [Clunio marinus]|uniref:CLUMA_CG003956, isoform A n=1 Tax=Clunio marinus TaxID=568069 RepID=A0A1J1HQC6_9DIPT|nr:CLUMA_CG003956, isoform A [Clunio marinus]
MTAESKNFRLSLNLKIAALFVGWWNLLNDCVCIVALIVFPGLVSRNERSPALVFSIILLCVLGIIIFFTYLYIDGIESRNHRKLEVFRIICIISIILYSITTFALLDKSTLGRFNNIPTEHYLMIIMVSIFLLFVQIVEFLVVNSAYKKLRYEQLPAQNPINILI